MQRAVSRPLANLLEEVPSDATVFVLGCGDCATREQFGGEAQCRALAENLAAEGVRVCGWSAPALGEGTCDPRVVRTSLEEAADALSEADLIVLLACPQGEAAVSRGSGLPVVVGTQLIVGGPTGGDQLSVEECSFCAECTAEAAGGLCPYAFCPKNLINGPCGGAQSGRCEVSTGRPCVWELIYRRLHSAGRLDVLDRYHEPVSFEIAVEDGQERRQ